MKAPMVHAKATAKLTALVCLLMALSVPAVSRLDALWQEALEAQEQGNTGEAVARYETWIEAARREGLRSPEAHYNLGLALWAEQKPARAVPHLVESARLFRSPLQTWNSLDKLDRTQKALGVREPVTSQLVFRWKLFVPEGLRLWLLSLAFWLVVGATVVGFTWLRAPSRRSTRRAVVGTAVGVGFGLVVGAGVPYQPMNYAVISSTEGTQVFPSPDRAAETALLTLPPGTVVSFEPGAEGTLRITGPVAGWIAAEEASAAPF